MELWGLHIVDSHFVNPEQQEGRQTEQTIRDIHVNTDTAQKAQPADAASTPHASPAPHTRQILPLQTPAPDSTTEGHFRTAGWHTPCNENIRSSTPQSPAVGQGNFFPRSSDAPPPNAGPLSTDAPRENRPREIKGTAPSLDTQKHHI